MNALANLLKAGTSVESDKPVTEAGKIEEALAGTVPAIFELTDEQKLYADLNSVAAGRLESDIPLSDDYWSIKQSITRQLHVLKHGE